MKKSDDVYRRQIVDAGEKIDRFVAGPRQGRVFSERSRAKFCHHAACRDRRIV